MIADVPTIKEDLEDLVVDVTVHLDPLPHLLDDGVVPRIVRHDICHQTIVVFRGPGPRRRVTLEIVQLVLGHIPVVTHKRVVLFLFQVMQTPILAIDEDHTRPRGLRHRTGLSRQTLHQLIAHEGDLLIMTRRSQQDVLEPVTIAVRENAAFERSSSPSTRGVQVKPLDRKIMRGVPVDLHVALLPKHQSAVRLVKFDVHQTLPLIAALRVIPARRVPRHVYADVRIKQVDRIGRQRNHRQRIPAGTQRVNPETAGDRGARQGVLAKTAGAHHPPLVNLAGRRQPPRHGGYHRIVVGLPDSPVQPQRRHILRGILARLRAVQGESYGHARALSGEDELERRRMKSSRVRKLRRQQPVRRARRAVGRARGGFSKQIPTIRPIRLTAI